jgi:hypothetical protein
MRLLSIRLKSEAPREVSDMLHRLRPIQRPQVNLRGVDPRVIQERLQRLNRPRMAGGEGNRKSTPESMRVANEAAQQHLIGVEKRLVSVRPPEWLHVPERKKTPVVAPKPVFERLD